MFVRPRTRCEGIFRLTSSRLSSNYHAHNFLICVKFDFGQLEEQTRPRRQAAKVWQHCQFGKYEWNFIPLTQFMFFV